MQTVYILSYQTLHRKTIDILTRLKLSGYQSIVVFVLPLHYKKSFKPIYEHRPTFLEGNILYNIGYEQAICNLGYELKKIADFSDIDVAAGSVFLVAGSGIIPKELIEKYIIINAHPGYIPNVRGLDALKWAIVNDEPIGVTTHILGDFVDAGEIIERREIPVFYNDTFHMVAYRQYETEINMIVEAIKKIDNISFSTEGEDFPINKRMPAEIEETLMEKFDLYIKKHSKL